VAWLDRAVAEGFLRAGDRDLLLEAPEPEGLLEELLTFQAPARAEKWIAPEDR
jgi:hypothetical protein